MDEQTRLRYASEVRPERLRQGKTQDQLAKEAGVSRNTVASMESGGGVPQAEKLLRVMLVLGINPEAADPEWLQEWWRVIAPLARRLPEARRGEVFGDIIVRLHQGLTEPSVATVHELRPRPTGRVGGESDSGGEPVIIAAMDPLPGEDPWAVVEGMQDLP